MNSQDYKRMIDKELDQALDYGSSGNISSEKTHLNQAGYILDGWIQMNILSRIRQGVDTSEEFLEAIREQGREEILLQTREEQQDK